MCEVCKHFLLKFEDLNETVSSPKCSMTCTTFPGRVKSQTVLKGLNTLFGNSMKLKIISARTLPSKIRPNEETSKNNVVFK